ncbi:MAG: TonB-dependent receptor [Pseudomonadota bacterium]
MYCHKLSSVSLLMLLLSTQINAAEAPGTGAIAEKDIEEVLVISRREGDYSMITEHAQKIIDVPGSLGDPLMAVFSLPGVLSQGEAGAPAVRGSSPSDNRYMVDGAPAGYVFHSFSTSIFNENILQDFELYSAGFGPKYSNAIGGVFDIKLRDPKHEPLSTKLDISMLRGGIFLESEINESSAFYLSARSSLMQYFFNDQSKKALEEEEGIRVETLPQDTDYQFKYVYDINENNQLKISANGATDLAAAKFTNLSKEVLEDPDFAGDAKIKTKFNNAVINWRATGDHGAVMNIQAGQYANHTDTHWGDGKYLFNIKNSDSYLIANYEVIVANNHNVSVGTEVHQLKYRYNARFINYVCTDTDPDCALRRGELVNTNDTINVNENMLYVNDHWEMNSKFAVDVGAQAHYNNFTKETFFNPRFATTWNFIDDWTLSSSLGAYNRFPEIDKLFPEIGNPDLQSPTSNHFTLGLKHNIDNGWSWSVTGYYKTMDDLPLAMKANETPNYTNNIEGEAYGVDIFINKELTDKWYGWLAISASKSLRTDKLTNIERNYYLDTPLVMNWVMNYKLTTKWTLGTRLTIQTGHAYTPIVGVQKNPYFDNNILPVYGEAFSENLPTYSRVDLRFKYDTTFWGYKGTYNIDILNALNTKNVTDRNLDYKRTTSTQDFKLEDEVGLGIIPAVGMSITF